MRAITKKMNEMKDAGVPLKERTSYYCSYSEGLRQGKKMDEAMAYAELTAEKRNKLQDKTFAVPSERKFPIHDRSHAANALARASGTKYEAQVKAAVHKKYPDMGKAAAQ